MSLQELVSKREARRIEDARLDEEIAQARVNEAVARRIEEVSSRVPVVKKVPKEVFAITSLPASFRRKHGEKKWWATQADGSPQHPEGPPLNGLARFTGGINENLDTLLSTLPNDKARLAFLREYRVPSGKEEWWTGKTDAKMGTGLPSIILKGYKLATSPDGTLFVLRAGETAYCVVEKTGPYSFLPGSKETYDKSLFQHGIPYKFVRMCTEAEKKVGCIQPTIVKHTIFC